MTEQPHREKGTLLLALVAGLAVNGSFAVLFSAVVPFSVFPLITLVLAVYCLHQRYMHHAMPDGMPLLVAASFLLGLLLYSAILRVKHPEIGSNFVPVILCAALLFWLATRLRTRKPQADGDSPS